MTSSGSRTNHPRGAAGTVDSALIRRATVGAAMGSVVEWYDVAVYGYLALTLGQLFFATQDQTTALLSSFAVFGAAFLVRPLGGMFFGTLGDRIGRQKTLAAVIMLASCATLGIGLLPTYTSIGIVAPVLLVALRFLQGFSAGGEMGGASAFVAEYAPPRRRGYVVSWVEVGVIAGFLVGATVVLLLNLLLTPDQVFSWGWRIPFLLAAPLGIVGLYIRSKLEETPEFAALRAGGNVSKRPLVESITQHWRGILSAAGYALFQCTVAYLLLTFVPNYLTSTLGYSSVVASTSSVVAMVIICGAIPVFGLLSDVVGRRRVLGGACVLAFVFAFPLFSLMGTHSPVRAVLAHTLLGLILAVFLGATLAAMNELFPTRVRYGGFSIGYNISASVFGGTAPLVVTLLITKIGVVPAPSLYLMAVAGITLIAVLCTRETAPAVTTTQDET